jgi:hypothetical protein
VVTDIVVTQSSDQAFHCVAITVWYLEDLGEEPKEIPKPVVEEVQTKDTKPLRRLNFSAG